MKKNKEMINTVIVIVLISLASFTIYVIDYEDRTTISKEEKCEMKGGIYFKSGLFNGASCDFPPN